MTQSNKKTFISAIFSSEYIQYKLHIFMFAFLPCALVYLYFLALRADEYRFSFLMMLVTLACLLLGSMLGAFFYIARNYAPYKIMTDQSGLYYSSMLRHVYVRWDQVISVKIISGIRRGIFQLITQNEKINIPILMKEIDNPYPKLAFTSNKWINADGSKMPVTAESCPLFIEIQKHIEGRI